MSSRFFFLIAVASILAISTSYLLNEHAPWAKHDEPAPAFVASAASAPLPQADIASTSTSFQSKKTNPPRPTIKVATSTPAETGSRVESVLVDRVQKLYAFPPESFEKVNDDTRAALVNILCSSSVGSVHPISGSGVIIDPRGVILTNAHIAQYVLLTQDPRVVLSCVVRTGTPARAAWIADVLYIPPAWIKSYMTDITSEQPTGTGEKDYALLQIASNVDGSPLPMNATFPSLPIDTREGIGFLDDQILAASYPAEFVGGIATQYDLSAVSSVSTIKTLLTFGTSSIDVMSLGGVIEAQSGSSGGAIVNAWGRLIGIISTTSSGATTGERDLHALTLSYIDRDLLATTGHTFESILDGDIAGRAADFRTNVAPGLIKLLIDQLVQHQT